MAISADEKQPLVEMQRELAIPFSLLSDADNAVIKRYGLAHVAGGNEGQDIARPAEILIDGQGMVRWVMYTENFRVRVRPEDVLAAADKL